MRDNLLLRTLAGEITPQPPVWLMRQAGRYLPEYRELRATAGGFMDLCFSPRKAAEVTIQPIRRFGFDAAILFSDILVVPHAFGLKVWFAEGEGPHVEGLFARLGHVALGAFDLRRLDPVFETLGLLRGMLGPETALIGFCGAPFTVASYMVAGRSSPDQAEVRTFAYRQPEDFAVLIDRLVDASVEYLLAQVQAGAQVLQIFNSWAGILPEDGISALERRSRWPPSSARCGQRRPTCRSSRFRARLARNCRLAVAGIPDAAIGLGTGEALRRCPRNHAAATARHRAISIRWRCWLAARRLMRPWQGILARDAGASACVQSRPRHPAADADRKRASPAETGRGRG